VLANGYEEMVNGLWLMGDEKEITNY